MMHIRRVLTLAVAVATLAGAPALVAQQNNQQPNRRDQERRSQQEQRDTQALVQMVDAVAAGKQPAPTDIGITWVGNHFVKSVDGSIYIPFTLAVDTSKLAAPGTVLYVRAVSKATAAAPPEVPQNNRDRSQQQPAVVYPWDQRQFTDLKQDGKLSRVMLLKPGEYDVFVAIKEKSPLEPQRNQPPGKAGLMRRALSVPDYGMGDLSISTPIVASAVDALPTPLTPEQQLEDPYTFGGVMRVVPSQDARLKTSGEFLMVFWVYGTQHVSGKPDVQIEYNFHQKTAEGEKYFNKAQPQNFNASTLQPNFDLTAGHQVLSVFAVPLKSFPVGDYRVEFKITDKISGKTLTQSVNFTVEA